MMTDALPPKVAVLEAAAATPEEARPLMRRMTLSYLLHGGHADFMCSATCSRSPRAQDAPGMRALVWRKSRATQLPHAVVAARDLDKKRTWGSMHLLTWRLEIVELLAGELESCRHGYQYSARFAHMMQAAMLHVSHGSLAERSCSRMWTASRGKVAC